MTDSPRTVSRAREFARKVVPLRIRSMFVTTVERITRRTWKAGTHHARRTAAAVMPEADRREALTELARNWAGYGTTVRSLRLMDLVDGELLKDPCLADFWETFLGEIALLDGINGEPWATEVGWRDVNDELACADRTEAARDEMQMRVAGVLDALTGTAQ